MRWPLLRRSPEERLLSKIGRASPSARFFAGAAGPGRAAYLILCLERALTALGQSPADWSRVLDRLWTLAAQIPAGFGEYAALYDVYSLLPAHVLPFERYEDVRVLPLSDAPAELWEPENGRTYLSEEDFRVLRALYLRAGWRMAVLGPLLSLFWEESWNLCADSIPSWPQGLEGVFEAETLLRRWSIPLPREETPEAVRALLEGGKGPLSGREKKDEKFENNP